MDHARKHKESKAALSFKELATAYMEEHSKATKRTWKEDQNALDRLILLQIGGVPAKEVTADQVFDIIKKHANTSKAQADRTKALLSSIYNWARKERLVNINPADRMKKFYERKRRVRVFSHDELRRLWARLSAEDMSENDKMANEIIKLAILLGQRLHQISGARKSELHDLNGTAPSWHIPGVRNKNKDDLHVVPLPPLAAELLARAASRSFGDHVFQSIRFSEKSIHADTITHVFADICKELKINGATLHAARHTFKTELSKLKITKDTLDRITSHKSGTSSMSEWYDHHDYFEDKLAALRLWERRLLEIIEGREPGANAVQLPVGDPDETNPSDSPGC
jgi:integrase